MEIKMDYGRKGLMIEVPGTADVFVNKQTPAVKDEAAAIQAALEQPIGLTPLRQLLKPGMTVVIIHTDITRATPNKRLLPVILDYLEDNGIKRRDITLLNALGTHRPQTQDELKQMLGEHVVENYRCLQHDAFDQSQLVDVGQSQYGHPIGLNRRMLEANLKILTGFIEPHFFAGYSGGPKAILPGVASAETISANHSPGMIMHPNADFDYTIDNPIWEEIKGAALGVDNTFLVNVTLDQSNKITGVFAGDVIEAHQKGCQFVKDSSLFPITEPYDLVVTSNSGYPLDQNLYQCVKGMAAAKRAVRKEGAILMLASCEEGLPDHGMYARLLREAGSLETALKNICQSEVVLQDSWQVLIQAQVQQHADVYVYSEGLSDEQIKMSLLNPCRDIPVCLKRLVQQYGSRVCVLPQGPLTILQMGHPST